VRLIVVIPARMAAQRLPGKPLADIGGRPMVVRVAEACGKARGIDRVVVATDHLRIAAAVEDAGFTARLTSENCKNGTERVAEAARSLEADAFINVQGDEPLVDPAAISSLAMLLREGVSYGTLARPLLESEADKPSVVKVVLDGHGRALYFSRSLVPFPRTQGLLRPLAHLGLYGFSRDFLQTFAALPETALEQAEGLEQLRALFHGHPLHVRVGDWVSPAVDTPEDLEHVRALWEARQDGSHKGPPGHERRTA
jgi:3-deoxy-manno-octulosonate cytidylyltransferase (CMP-KDO synthetase)